MILQPIIDLVAICARKGIKNVILSPGSRCAPVTLAFARHPDIHCRTISDERSAAFIALGMAQQLQKPVALVCTSGTAALNYAPAIAEAYFQQIPLMVITADRPPEWIDQWDGQTIRQERLFGRHIKADYQFPDDFTHPDKVWHAHRISNEAINQSQTFPAGPVHINIPMREPFYPASQEKFDYNTPIPVTEEVKGKMVLSEDDKIKLKNKLDAYRRILIVPGQQRPDPKIQKFLDKLVENNKAVVVTDSISNLQSSCTINYHDQFLATLQDTTSFQPDLIISFGKSIISKPLKLHLRNSQADHWHIQPYGYFPDTYQKLAKLVHSHPVGFLEFLDQALPGNDGGFVKAWKTANDKLAKQLKAALDQAAFGEWKALHLILPVVPEPSKMHLANSMAVRYVNFLGPRPQEVICNRGASGIDGSNSTAVGCTFTTKDFVTLITGDLAFFYDRNAFWHNYPLSNLRVILLNNHAGGIFRLIDGPSQQPELEEYFETQQQLDAKNLAKDFGFRYYLATDESTLSQALEEFYHPSIHPKILEIPSNSAQNAAILQSVKATLKK